MLPYAYRVGLFAIYRIRSSLNVNDQQKGAAPWKSVQKYAIMTNIVLSLTIITVITYVKLQELMALGYFRPTHRSSLGIIFLSS